MAHARAAKVIARMVWVDAGQIVRHGWSAPRWAERIWIDPKRCRSVALDLDTDRDRSGQMVGGEWNLLPIESVEKVRMAEEHWRTGATWEEVGAYDYAMDHLADLSGRDGYQTAAEVRRRFENLDHIFEGVRREGRLRPRSELPGRSWREHRGIYMHVGPGAEPVFGNGGCHRLVMARVLELPEVPAQLGVVHPDAHPTWRALRSPADG